MIIPWCKAPSSHNLALGNDIKAICCVKTIEVANEVIREYEIKTGTKYSIHRKKAGFCPKGIFDVVEKHFVLFICYAID